METLANKLRVLHLKNNFLCQFTVVSFFWTTVGFSNITSSANQNFNPTLSSVDFISVYSARTLEKGQIDLGLSTDLSMNTTPYFYEDGATQGSRRKGLNDLQMSANTGAWYGLSNRFRLGLGIKSVLFQTIKDKDTEHGEFIKRGISELSLASVYTLSNSGLFSSAIALSFDKNLVKNNPYSGASSPIYANLQVVLDFYLGAINFAANAGYRSAMQSAKTVDDRIEPSRVSLLASLAASLEISQLNSDLIWEIYTLTPNHRYEDLSDRHTGRAETLVGLKNELRHDLIINYGITTELRHSVASPDLRMFFGINKVIGERTSQEVYAREPAVEKPDELIVLRELNFRLDSEQFVDDQQSLNYLAELSQKLNNGKKIRLLIIEGHTCSIGTKSYNSNLSRRRAKKIKEILQSDFNVSGPRIRAEGFGENFPVATNRTDSGRELNRRVEFKIYYE